MDSELPMDERVTMVDVDVDFDLHTEEQEAPRIPLRASPLRWVPAVAVVAASIGLMSLMREQSQELSLAEPSGFVPHVVAIAPPEPRSEPTPDAIAEAPAPPAGTAPRTTIPVSAPPAAEPSIAAQPTRADYGF